jgi:hypothetical protein
MPPYSAPAVRSFNFSLDISLQDQYHHATMNARQYKFTIQDIAVASGEKEQTIRMHIRRGWFNPEDLKSLSGYVISKALTRSVMVTK